MVGESSRVHKDTSSIRFTTIQTKRFNWEAWCVAGQEGFAGFADPLTEHEVAIVTYFLQCLVDAGNKEVVSDGGACVAIFGRPEFIQSFNQPCKGAPRCNLPSSSCGGLSIHADKR